MGHEATTPETRSDDSVQAARYQRLRQAVDDLENGNLAQAESACRAILAEQADFPEALFALGRIAVLQRDPAAAEAWFAAALRLRPQAAVLYGCLAEAQLHQGAVERALRTGLAGLALTDQDPMLLCQTAIALIKLDRWREAEPVLHRAIILHPHISPLWSNLGVAQERQGRLQAAIQAHTRAWRLEPRQMQAWKNLQLAQLLAGDLRQGWCPRTFRTVLAPLTPGTWDGSPLNGRTLLVYNIEGYGDAIHFARFLPDFARQGARVVVEAEPELERLFANLEGVSAFSPKGGSRPAHDARLFFQQIPHALGVTFETLPPSRPYLQPHAADVARWAERLGPWEKFRVGLVWAGSTEHPRDRFRSLSLAALAPLAAVPGTAFYALQKGPAVQQLATADAGFRPVALGADLHDFAETAAVLANLDLLIGVDTSVIHLAGAMGRPAWCLLPFVPDFRWTLEGETTPWYSSVRLFRQTRHHAWPWVISRVAMALHQEVRRSDPAKTRRAPTGP